MEKHIGLECRTVANMVMRTVNETNLFKQNADLTGVHGWVIAFLYNHRDRDIYQRDLEKRFNVRRSTVTQTLTLMEQRGLIVRSSVEGDARLKKLELTDTAIKMHELITKEIDRVERKVLSGIPQEDVDTCFRVLEAVKENIHAMCGSIQEEV